MASPILFYGQDNDALTLAMRNHAKEILELSDVEALENCGDYLEVFPCSKSKSYTFTMETISMLIEQSALPPLNGDKRVIAIRSVERMLIMHMNALLKTLEELHPFCHVVLTSTRKDDLLKTLLSRLQKRYIEESHEELNYSVCIKEASFLLEQKKYDSFFKKMEDLEKDIMQKQETVERKLHALLQSHNEVHLSQLQEKHLLNFYSDKLQILSQKVLTGYLANIKLRSLLEHLFLETRLLFRNT